MWACPPRPRIGLRGSIMTTLRRTSLRITDPVGRRVHGAMVNCRFCAALARSFGVEPGLIQDLTLSAGRGPEVGFSILRRVRIGVACERPPRRFRNPG